MVLTILFSVSTSERFDIFDSLDFISNDGNFCAKLLTSIPYISRSSSLVNNLSGQISALCLTVHCKQCQGILSSSSINKLYSGMGDWLHLVK